MNQTINKALKNIASDIVKDIGSITSRNLMSYTLPIKKSKGKRLRSDISKTMASPKQWAYKMNYSKESKQVLAMLNERGKNKTNAIKRKIEKNSAFNVKEFSPQLHEMYRVKGKVRGEKDDYVGTVVIQSSKVKKYKSEKAKSIGKCKSGWVGPLNSWYSRIPSWVRKQGKNGSFLYMKGSLNVSITNNIPYAKDALIESSEKCFKKAVDSIKKMRK